MSGSNTSGNQTRPIVLAITVALIAGTLMAGMLSYTMKRHDAAHARSASQASEQLAVAVSRQFAGLGGAIMGSDLFRLQDSFQKGFAGTTLVSAMLIDPDNMVIAAKDQAMIGQQMKDANWPSLRAQNKEIVSRTLSQDGQTTLAVIQPVEERGATIAWAQFVFALPAAEQFMMTPSARWIEAVRLVAPLAVLLWVAVWWAVRTAIASVRKEVAQVLGLVQGGKSAGASAVHLKKAS